MPEIHPIPAIRYASDTGDVTTRIAPPYDVLDEGPKQTLLQRDPHNIVAIDLPVTPPKTVGPDEAYAQAGRTLRRWLDERILRRDDQPALYAYEQVYRIGERLYRRRGLFANVTAEPFGRPGGGVHQHEHTIVGGIDDRTKLMNACRAQLSPVFGMFHDPRKTVSTILQTCCEPEPLFFGTTDNDDVEHRCWRIDDVDTVVSLHEQFRRTDVFIADGHHRYNTALRYAQARPDIPQAQCCLMALVACEDPGMIVLPTHRIVTGLTNFTLDALKAPAAACGFTIRSLDTPLAELPDQLPQAGHHAIGLYDPQTGRGCLLTTTGPDPLADLLPDKPAVWRTLDVAVLHELLIDRVLRPHFGGEAIGYRYTAELDEVPRLATGSDTLGIVMQPTPLDAVCDVSRAGEVMPPKSTYFFPKLATGLVINPLSPESPA